MNCKLTWIENERGLFETEYQPVLRVRENVSNDILKIDGAGWSFKCTSGHRFWTARGQWVRARDLTLDDLLLSSDGSSVTISAISRVDADVNVYNLSIANNHNFFASEARVLTHNCFS